mgnify:CR=1 FL=1
MPKKTITIEVDTDEISNALKSENNVVLKLTVASNSVTNNSVSESEYFSPEDIKEMEKETGWPF